MLRAFSPNCFFANIAGTLVFIESNAMSPCSRIAASTKLVSEGAIELRLYVWRDFDEKLDENRSKIGCESESPPKSAVEALLGAFWQRFSRFLTAWGRFWVTFSLPEAENGHLTSLGQKRLKVNTF